MSLAATVRCTWSLAIFAQAALGQATFTGIGVPDGAQGTAAYGLSDDGRVVVGSIRWSLNDTRPMAWTSATGAQSLTGPSNGLDYAEAWSPHGDLVGCRVHSTAAVWRAGAMEFLPRGGSVCAIGPAGAWFVGNAWLQTSPTSGTLRACRWAGSGRIPEFLPGPGLAGGASGTADVVVGGNDYEPLVWLSGTLHTAATLPQFPIGRARGVARDGSLVVGYLTQYGGTGGRACRWTPDGDTATLLAVAPGGLPASAAAASNGGSVIAGGSTSSGGPGRAVVWLDNAASATNAKDLFESLGLNLSGWELTDARAVSPDGVFLAGTGVHAGRSEGWVASLPRDVGCYINCDASTLSPVLNVADFTCFLQRFAAGEPYANCDGSTAPPILNVADFTCFLQKFAARCP